MRALGYFCFALALATIGGLLVFVSYYDDIIGHLESPREEAAAPSPAPSPSPSSAPVQSDPAPAPTEAEPAAPDSSAPDSPAPDTPAPSAPTESDSQATDAAPPAGAPLLSLPLDCAWGEVCVVQQYADVDPGPEAKDYRCGPLAYGEHGGTDLRTRTWAQMEDGVPVIAAAPGVVRALRDGMADIPLYDIDPETITGRNAGNVVILRHENGWETSYAHMKQGSVLVEEGERVARGQPLGEIGLSGNTEFPHLHFGVRLNGEKIDPFTGRPLAEGCGQPTAGGLWSDEAAEVLAYQPGGLLDLGFASEPPELRQAAEGELADFAARRDDPALIFWALSWGVRAGDEETLTFLAPDGEVLAQSTELLEDTKIQWFRYVGRRQPDGGWPAGSYTGRYELWRDGELYTSAERTFTID